MPTVNTIKAAMDMNPAQQEYLNWLTKAWLPGLFVGGAAFRGLTGLGQIMGQNLTPNPSAPEPTVINIPYRSKKKEQPPTEVEGSSKMASFWGDALGDAAKKMSDIPMAMPINVFGGAGAGILGYKLSDMLVNKLRDKIQSDQTEAAKKEYEKALLSQFEPIPEAKVKPVSYQPPTIGKMSQKQASLNQDTIKTLLEKKAAPDSHLGKLSDKLDRLMDKASEHLEKKADPDHYFDPNTMTGQLSGKLLGMYSVLAPMLAGGTGLGVYHYLKSTDPSNVVQKEWEEKTRERAAKRPAEMFARLVPVDEKGLPLNNHKTASDKDSDLDAKAAKFVQDLLGRK